MHRSWSSPCSVLALGWALAACGPAPEAGVDPTDPTAEVGGEGEAISQRTPAFVRLTHDYRRCISPLCGGYWVQDLNRTTEPVYVSGLDFSESDLSDADQDRVRGGAEAGQVLRAHLGPIERQFNTRALMVMEAYEGLPGVTARDTDRFYGVATNDPPITCITAPCNNDSARLINTGRTWSSFTSVDVRLAMVPFADEAWTVSQIERHGAVVAAHFEDGDRLPGGRARLLVVSQAYVRLGQAPVECPLVRPAPCAAGETYLSARTADRCLVPDGCSSVVGVCPAFSPSCSDGYELATWIGGPTGCPVFRCDPQFSLAEPPAPTGRCLHVRCTAETHCVEEGDIACVPNVTCANVRCGGETRCIEDNGGVSCQPWTWTSEDVGLASRSPYANNTRQAWVFTSEVPGSTMVRIHFARFDLEKNYDFVIVETTDGVELARYSGALGEFTTDAFSGEAVRIRFTTDGSVTKSGFLIDRIDVRNP